MRKMWLSSVVAGLLVLAPVAAIAQSGLGDDPEETEVREVATEEATEDASSGTGVLQQEESTDTVDDGEGDGDTGLDQDETTDTVDDGEDGDDPAGESNDHGERVSTVARCAPTGKLDIEGFGNHGAFVRAVAHGETIEIGEETFDLSTAEGVETLCEWAEMYEPPAGSASTEGRERGRPEHAGPPEGDGASDGTEEPEAVEPEETGDVDEDSDGEDADGASSRGGGKGNGKGGGNGPGHVGVR